MVSEEELEMQVREEERFLERCKDSLGVEDNPVRLEEMGRSAMTKGICQLLLGHRESARESFRNASDYFVERVESGSEELRMYEPVVLRNALYCSLLSGESGLVRDTARKIMDLPETLPETQSGMMPSFHYARVMAGAARDELDEVEDSVGVLSGAEENIYTAVSIYAEGLLNDSPGMVQEGIQAALEAHMEGLEGEPLSFDEAFSPAATVMVLIACIHGVSVDVESGYIAENLLR